MKTLSTFSDIIPVLNAAVAAGGVTFECGSRAEAVRWRARAYSCRMTYRELQADKGRETASPWDAINISIEGARIFIRLAAPIINMTTLDGVPIDLTPKASPEEEELLNLVKGMDL